MSSYLYYTTLTRCCLKINKHKEGCRDFLDSLRPSYSGWPLHEIGFQVHVHVQVKKSWLNGYAFGFEIIKEPCLVGVDRPIFRALKARPII